MKKFLVLILIGIFYSSSIFSQQKKNNKYSIYKTEREWKNQLTEMQFFVLRKNGTEPQFSSPLNYNKAFGTYVCVACDTKLYESIYKYDSGSGWPSFDRSVKNNVVTSIDYDIGYARVELKCKTCGGHLGHAFEDGPKETTGMRHCINGIVLKFIPKKK